MALGGRRHRCTGFALLLLIACSQGPVDPDKRDGTAGAGAADGAAAGSDSPDLLACDEVVSEAGWARRAATEPNATVNRLLAKSDGRFEWNGASVDATTVRQYLDLVSTMTSSPRLVVSFEPGVKDAQRRALRGLISGSLHCRPDALG